MLLIFLASVAAQASPTATAVSNTARSDVVVLGSREGFKINTRALRAAQSEFLARKGQYAPNASLTFLVQRRYGRAFSARDLRIYATNGRDRISIDVHSDNTFSIAALPDAKWWVESNMSPRNWAIEPLVLSPGSNRTNYRLGDARLQCRASWAMFKASGSILAAPLVGVIQAAGPCTSRKVSIFASAPGPVQSAYVSEGSRTAPIKIGRGRDTYPLPGENPTFSNDARVTVVAD